MSTIVNPIMGKRPKPYKDPYLLSGYKQKEKQSFEHRKEQGNVAVIGRCSHTPFYSSKLSPTMISPNNPLFCTVAAVVRKIFKKHYGVTVESQKQPMTNLFPLVTRTHYTGGTHHALLMPYNNFFGIEWIVKIKRNSSINWNGDSLVLPPYQDQPDIDYRGVGFVPIHSLTGIQNNTTTQSISHTNHLFENYINNTCKLLGYGCGNVMADRMFDSQGSAAQKNNARQRQYPANYFYYLKESYNRSLTNPMDIAMEVLERDSEYYPVENVELFGYRIVEYDIHNTSRSTSQALATEWTYKFSQVHRIDTWRIHTEETAIVTVRNVTPADQNTTAEMSDQHNAAALDANPAVGRLFYFNGKPKYNETMSIVSTLTANPHFVSGYLTTTTDGNDGRVESLTLDGQDGLIDYSATGRLFDLFSAPDNNSLIFRENIGTAPNLSKVTMLAVPDPQQFENAKYTNIYIGIDKAIKFPTVYKFTGYFKDFLKNTNIRGEFPYPIRPTTTTVDYAWCDLASEDWAGTNSILCVERSRRHKLTEGAPQLEVDISIRRKSIVTGQKKLFMARQDIGTTYPTVPAQLIQA